MNVALIRAWIEAHEPNGQAKFAVAAEISPSTVTNVLNDGHEPTLRIARRMAKVLKVSLDELAGKNATPAA